MAKQQVQQKQPAATAATKPTAALTPFIFDRTNYLIMIAGVVVILIGFMLMSGGATTDPNVFPKEELYSFRRITLAPIVVMIGFGIEIFAILKRPKE
ncbi:MAG TPA: DUF3098 domain-containing protein [Chitinophagales bacterium]|nr:DUF3098 domain-containing protein [Chitinophagales bacterium]